MGDKSSGFLNENREAIIVSMAFNYASENPEDFFDQNRIENFIQNFDGKGILKQFKNTEWEDQVKELVHTIKNAQIRLKRKR